jgi:hypothetical protein
MFPEYKLEHKFEHKFEHTCEHKQPPTPELWNGHVQRFCACASRNRAQWHILDEHGRLHMPASLPRQVFGRLHHFEAASAVSVAAAVGASIALAAAAVSLSSPLWIASASGAGAGAAVAFANGIVHRARPHRLTA